MCGSVRGTETRRSRPGVSASSASKVATNRTRRGYERDCKDAVMDALHSIDLQFLGLEQEIGVYVFDTADGPALFDCGPASTLEHLRAGSPSTAWRSPTCATCCSRTSTSTTPARPERSSARTRS